MNDRIDLHTHSTVSDGTYAPAELVRYAKEKGLLAIALTDHDSIDGIDEALAVGQEVGVEVEVIPGVEFSADFSNGVAILAHPNTLRLPDDKLNGLFERLVNAGLDGIEVYYSTHTPEETVRYERLASEWYLVKTGGSDFHGKHKPQIDLGVGKGTLRVPYSLLETLRRRKGRRPA